MLGGEIEISKSKLGVIVMGRDTVLIMPAALPVIVAV
jgi:hypothetical protein